MICCFSSDRSRVVLLSLSVAWWATRFRRMCRPSRQRSQNEEATKRKDPFSRTSQYRTPFDWVVKDAPKQAVPVRVSLTHPLLSRQAHGGSGRALSVER